MYSSFELDNKGNGKWKRKREKEERNVRGTFSKNVNLHCNAIYLISYLIHAYVCTVEKVVKPFFYFCNNFFLISNNNALLLVKIGDYGHSFVLLSNFV